MTETFLFVRLGEGEVYRNVVWKLQKCHDRVGGDDDDDFVKSELARLAGNDA